MNPRAEVAGGPFGWDYPPGACWPMKRWDYPHIPPGACWPIKREEEEEEKEEESPNDYAGKDKQPNAAEPGTDYRGSTDETSGVGQRVHERDA